MKLLFLTSLVVSKPVLNQILPFGPAVETVSIQFDIPPHSEGQKLLSTAEIESVATMKLLETIQGLQVEVTSSYADLVHHIYFKQIYNGRPVANGFGAVHLTPHGEIVSLSHSFGTVTEKFPYYRPWELLSFGPKDYSPRLSRQDAVLAFISYLGLDHKSLKVIDDFHLQLDDLPKIPVSQAYLFVDGKPVLVWDIVIDLDSNWFHAQIDAQTGTVLQLVDWVSHSSFTVYPLGLNSPLDGGRERVIDPELKIASPLGWNTHVSKTGNTILNTDTQGNNVYAQSNPSGGNQWRRNHRPSGGKNLIFDFPLSLKKEPKSYLDAAIVNLFYLNNMIHDLFHLYGFNEPAGNFQDSNFKRGGRDSDAVIANCQDGSGTNNANFATPPDGTSGRMRMYIWTQSNPGRDGDLEEGIVIHEYAHGISTRLTGGPANSGCLGWGEAGGMGEGWGDFFATILRMNSNTTRNDDFEMGDYANGGKGIRKYPYSTSNLTNPSTYAFIRKPGYWGVHAKGEVWAEILYEVFWNLVDKHGWEDDYFSVPTSKKPSVPSDYPKPGNKLALRLVVDGLKLQPCSPSFVDARDAILLADKIGTNGENFCEIWHGFAKRGLGAQAEYGGRQDFSMPDECLEKV